MKIRLSLVQGTGPGMDSRYSDILVSADVTATVGEIAARLLSDQLPPREATLRIKYPGATSVLVLDPLATLPAAHLRPGSTVEAVKLSSVGPAEHPAFEIAGTLTDANGNVWPLVVGRNPIGRDKNARVWLGSRAVSRKHAEIIISNGRVRIADLGAANPLLVNDKQVAWAELHHGDTILVGNETLTYQTALVPVGIESPPTMDEHMRPPRVEDHVVHESITLPAPPEQSAPQQLPTLAILAPLLMGVASFAMTRSPYSLVLVAMSPLMMLGSWLDGILGNKKGYKRQLAKYRQGLIRLDSEIADKQLHECRTRIAQFPDTAQLSAAIVGRTDLLWTRRPEHATFLHVRVGTGSDLSRTRLSLPERGKIPDQEWTRLCSIQRERELVGPVPLLVSLAESGGVGVVGDSEASSDVTRHVLLSLAGLHAPSDVVLSAITSTSEAKNWNWLKWLPHVDHPHSPISGDHLATGAVANQRLIARLEELVASRQANAATSVMRSHLPKLHRVSDSHGAAVTESPPLPAVIALIAGNSEIETGRLVQLAEAGPDVGVYTLWLQADKTMLPAACRSFIEIPHDLRATLNDVRSAVRTPVSNLDRLSQLSAERLARELAGVNDAGAKAVDDSDLPSKVTLHELSSFDIAGTPQGVVAAWRASDSLISNWQAGSERILRGLPATVGMGVDGALSLDLREQGPHALVGGTTGAGKSEFLQTWIVSMASATSPDRLTFLLVDYKGGAAFAECVDLPHTVGLVTDLSPHLVQRSLTSLRAELTYREHLFNEYGAKDLAMMERRSDSKAPPSLVIVIDEFAALAADVPEFVDGVVDVAARGRSLGVHLIMATQRPSGVITNNLRANTNLRVALRMADPSDSTDVIDTELAAHFDPALPGRGTVRIGPGRIITFQTAYIGGMVKRSAAEPDLTIYDLPFGVGRRWPSQPLAMNAQAGAREIETIVRNVRSAATALTLASPRRPWLEQLPEIIDLHNLTDVSSAARIAPIDGPRWVIGIQDEPAAQTQTKLVFSPERSGHMVIIGAAASGKSAALRTLAATATECATVQAPVWCYGIASGNGLSPLCRLPNTGDVLDVDDIERVPRLLKWLLDLAKQRTTEFARGNASTHSEWLALQTDKTKAKNVMMRTRIVLLIDGYAALQERFEFNRQFDFERTLDDLLAFGAKVGVHVVVSADRQRSIPQRYRGYFGAEIILRVTEDDAGAADIPPGFFDDAPAGRGMLARNGVQLAVPGGATTSAEIVAAFDAIAESWSARFAHLDTGEKASGDLRAPAVRLLPERFQLSALPPTDGAGNPAIALADDDFSAVGYSPKGLTAVLGNSKSGTSTALRTIVAAFGRAGNSGATVLWLTPDKSETVAPAEAEVVSGVADVSRELLRMLATDGVTGSAGANNDPVRVGNAVGSVTHDSATGWDFSISSAMAVRLNQDGADHSEPEHSGGPWLGRLPMDGEVGPFSEDSEASVHSGLVVIERLTEFIGTTAEDVIERFLNQSARSRLHVVVEAETSLVTTSWEFTSALKTATTTVLLRAAEGDGRNVTRVAIPEEDCAEFPPGRGYLIAAGRVRKVQVAYP